MCSKVLPDSPPSLNWQNQKRLKTRSWKYNLNYFYLASEGQPQVGGGCTAEEENQQEEEEENQQEQGEVYDDPNDDDDNEDYDIVRPPGVRFIATVEGQQYLRRFATQGHRVSFSIIEPRVGINPVLWVEAAVRDIHNYITERVPGRALIGISICNFIQACREL